MAVVMAYENDLAKGKKGETHPNAVLTEKQAIEIYVRANKGENQRKLSEEFGIAQSVVSQIKIGSRWPHLSEVSGD